MTKRNLVVILVSMIATWVAAEMAIFLTPIRAYRTPNEVLVDHQRRRADAIGNENVVLLGDSNLGNAIIESRLAKILGQRCQSLPLTGYHGVLGDRLMFERVLSAGVRPSALVIFHTPDAWMREVTPDIADATKLALESKYLDALAPRIFHSLPSVRKSRAMKSILFQPGPGIRLNWATYEDQLSIENETLAALDGRTYLRQSPSETWKDISHIGLGRFLPNQQSDEALTAIVHSADALDMPVFLVVGPLAAPTIDASADFLDSLKEWLQEFSRRFVHCRVLIDTPVSTPISKLGNSNDHLNSTASAQFTDWFGNQLRAQLVSQQAAAAVEPFSWSD